MFQDTFYSRKRTRLNNFDYSSARKYFVTTNVKWRHFSFGEVVDGKMQLNKYGEIVKAQWEWLINQYTYLESHAFVIMPDHVHAVIEIQYEYQIDTKIKSLSEIIGAFKTRSSKEIHLAGAREFQWHRSFFDKVIDSDIEFKRYVKYTNENPRNYNT